MNWDYVAGFIDGEGSVALYINDTGDKFHVKSALIIAQAGEHGKRLLADIAEFVGKGKVRGNGASTTGRPVYVVSFTGKTLDLVLRNISTRCFVKQGQVDLLIEAREIMASKTSHVDKYTEEQQAYLHSLTDRVRELKRE